MPGKTIRANRHFIVYPFYDRGGLQMSETGPEPNDVDATGQVLLFRQRHHVGRLPLHPAAGPIDAAIEPEDDLAQYEQDEQIDYRQRMLMNVIAVAICTMLGSPFESPRGIPIGVVCCFPATFPGSSRSTRM